MTEISAENVEGFILWSPITKQYFFRIYNPDKTFTDYDLKTEEIHVKILDSYLVLKDNCLSWSSKALGRKIV